MEIGSVLVGYRNGFESVFTIDTKINQLHIVVSCWRVSRLVYNRGDVKQILHLQQDDTITSLALAFRFPLLH